LSPGRVLAASALLLCACVWAGCAGSRKPAVQVATSEYVGAETCAECHADIFKKQAASPHALTARPASAEWAAGKVSEGTRVRDPQTGQEYGLAEREGKFWQLLFKNGKEAGAATLDLLIGSGHHGVSPLTLDGDQWRYLALTYYANKGWDLSPMHGVGEASASLKDAHGWPVSTSELETCLWCHTTRLELQGSAIDPHRSELGIRCEGCHGPGRKHVEAARNRSTDLAISNPGGWSTSSHMALCQQCHNETSTLEGLMTGIPEDPKSPSTVKYHVYGIEQSQCFIKSAGKFRCTSCHDPHAKAESSPAFYEARCLGCHTQGQAAQKACPVNARKDCLSCHMPKVQIERHTYFADHWIRARSPFVDVVNGRATPKKRSPPSP
jgi:hypothetical protein